MKILLVEPDYKNKYPPMGLMKISTYHKNKGDFVYFVKGNIRNIADEIWDRIYITTLFTFDYEITVNTIRYYKRSIENTDNIYVGGILASLMSEQLKKDANIEKVIVGQLTNSRAIGFFDNVNIDTLPLDYDILDDINYVYPAGDNYFAYITRGCPNKCPFCAVPILEPCFTTIDRIQELIKYTDKEYGPKRGLLLLDNNILNSPDLRQIVDNIKSVGFTKDNPYYDPILFDLYYEKAKLHLEIPKFLIKLLNYLTYFEKYIPKGKKRANYQLFIEEICASENPLDSIKTHENELRVYFGKYHDKRPKYRFVDFNQGVDARLINDDNMRILSELPIRPLRIAFDSITQKRNYIRSVRLAHKYGINDLSNYILYNYKDRPKDLWERLRINIDLNNELGISIFSFPMKYSPIDQTNRDFVGKFWHKKYLRGVTAILLVTKGIVAAGGSFFFKAYGNDINEFLKILTMPRDFIIYRKEFEENGLSFEWEAKYSILDESDKSLLLDIIDENEYICSDNIVGISAAISDVLAFYKIRHSKKHHELEQPSFNFLSVDEFNFATV